MVKSDLSWIKVQVSFHCIFFYPLVLHYNKCEASVCLAWFDCNGWLKPVFFMFDWNVMIFLFWLKCNIFFIFLIDSLWKRTSELGKPSCLRQFLHSLHRACNSKRMADSECTTECDWNAGRRAGTKREKKITWNNMWQILPAFLLLVPLTEQP